MMLLVKKKKNGGRGGNPAQGRAYPTPVSEVIVTYEIKDTFAERGPGYDQMRHRQHQTDI